MSGFQWDARFDLGVEEMNREHKVLIDKMNKVESLAEKGASKVVVRAALQDLGKATYLHFQSEEAYMARIGFPLLATHKVVHESLLEKFGRHVAAFDKGNGELPEGFLSFLQFWLRAHICGVDKKYAEHVQRSAA